MLQFICIIGSVFISVNLPLVVIGSTKRLGAVLLFFAVLIAIKGVKKAPLVLLPAVVFWWAFFCSFLLGIIANQVINPFVFSIAFSFLVVSMLYLVVDIKGAFVKPLCVAVLLLNLVACFEVASVISFNPQSIFFLRKYLLESSVPINSTFNQMYTLFFLNSLLFLILARWRWRWCFGGFALLILITTIFSLSRQNFLAITVLLSFLSLGYIKSIWFYVGLVILVGFGFVLFFSELDQLGYILSRIERTQAQLSGGGYSRFQQYLDSIQAGLTYPFQGLGVAGFERYAELNGYPKHTRVPEAAVNQLAAEHGVFMLLLFASVMGFYIIHFYRNMDAGNMAGRLGVAYLLGFVVLCFFNEVHVTPGVWAMFPLLFMVNNFLRCKNGICISQCERAEKRGFGIKTFRTQFLAGDAR